MYTPSGKNTCFSKRVFLLLIQAGWRAIFAISKAFEDGAAPSEKQTSAEVTKSGGGNLKSLKKSRKIK